MNAGNLLPIMSDLTPTSRGLSTRTSTQTTVVLSSAEHRDVGNRVYDGVKAGLQRKGFDYMDLVQTVSMAPKICLETRLLLIIIFVDYEKAFDSVETKAILSALIDQGDFYSTSLFSWSLEQSVMNDETCPSQPTVKQIVKIPRNRLENRLYKQGLVDDNNVHLSYFNFRVLWPALALSVTMYALFLAL
ncbi:hypothetical protein RB195_010270 [Necator americanus]|uniref:Reverse transcriptase domain-containing protein n=1 Tax=Necator americanus TaxID=51031 RepID=A0ABR1D0J1_NECAM